MTTTTETVTRLCAGDALKIAGLDAKRVYPDLSPCRITVSIDDQKWRIDYELKDEEIQGGGSRYLIDSVTGTILEKREG